MFGCMTGFIVTMNICPFHVRKAFQLVLEIFGNVVSFSQTLLWVEDNVHLDNNPRTGVPCTDGIKAYYMRAVSHRWDHALAMDECTTTSLTHKCM